MSLQRYNIQLARPDTSINWGFRIEGGMDYGQSVSIQNVVQGSLADQFGLKLGDRVIRINQTDTKWMKHDDVKMEIIRSNNQVQLLIERSTANVHQYASTIVPTSQHPNYTYQNVSPRADQWTSKQQSANVCKPKVTLQLTSKSVNNYDLQTNSNVHQSHAIGVSHNVSPTPFGQSPPVPGQEFTAKSVDGRVKKISHSNYNSPMGLYAQKHCNQTFEQTLNMATGANSPHANSAQCDKPNATKSMYCDACGNIIRDKVVKVQGRIPMHPECLKCCKCGVGLRNVGYFYIDKQLYCETHAKQAAPPPEQGMKAVVVYK